jgi:hypothetical protein
MSEDVPSFDDFVRPLLGDSLLGDAAPPVDTPLSELAVGDYAVLAWLDGLRARFPAHVEADLVAQWDTASPRDVYAMLFADADSLGGSSS